MVVSTCVMIDSIRSMSGGVTSEDRCSPTHMKTFWEQNKLFLICFFLTSLFTVSAYDEDFVQFL